MSAPAPPKPVHLTQAQKNLIRATPIHRQIKHCVYSVLAVSALGCLVTLAVTVSSCVAARSLIDDHRWLIFHYVMASLFACLWLAFAGIYYRDVKFGAWSDQLKLDGAWLSFVVTFSSSFLFYVFYKLRTLATLESLGEHCVFECESGLRFIRLSPLLVGIGNLVLLGVQIALLVVLYRNPIVNPPLDEHGMPKPINPLNGEVMPLGPDGQPILPRELRPPSVAKADARNRIADDARKAKAQERDAPEWESEVSDSSSLGEDGHEDDDEKRLLNEDEKGHLSRELGRQRRERQLRRKRDRTRGYDAV
ncbi:hypothetical protein JCM3766R1_000125 [Sporobolomyces carnicolor]